MSDLNSKPLREIEEYLATKAAELTKLFVDNETIVDGEKQLNFTKAQLEDVRARHAELNEIGQARDLVRVRESAKSISDELAQPMRPSFGQQPIHHEQKSIGQAFVESAQFKQWQVTRGRESEPFETGVSLKTLLTTTTGWPPESSRSGVVVPFATYTPQILDLIPKISSTQNAFTYMEETTYTNAAVEVAEGALKPEAALALTPRTSPVRKIAVWIPVTDEQLEDVPGMQSYIETRLAFMVNQRLARQVLVGDGTGVNLLGIVATPGVQTQAKGVDPTPDAVLKAMNKVRSTGQATPSAYVTHPNDWAEIRLLRTTDGIYIWGNPSESGVERIWGIPVIVEPGLTEGTGLTGDFANYSLLIERKPMTIKVGYKNDDFIKNIRSIVAEIRVAFVVTRPTAFCLVTGI